MNRRDAIGALAGSVAGLALPNAARAGGSMATRKVPSNGELPPVIGTWQTFNVGRKPEERLVVEQVLREFVALGAREAEQRLLSLACERGVAVIASRPFMGGDVFRRLHGKPLPGWATDIDCSSWAQLLLKFALSHPVVTCVIPATSKPDHRRDNMRAGYGRMPDQKQRALIVHAVAA